MRHEATARGDSSHQPATAATPTATATATSTATGTGITTTRPTTRRLRGIEWEDDMVDVNRITTSANTRWKLVDRDTGAANHAIDWRFRVGDRVKLRLVNELDSDHPMHHPFHVHGAGRFVVLARDGAHEQNLVWKDTVLVRTGETVDILLDVTNPGVWMAHCHIAEHHESGMMFSFTVDPADRVTRSATSLLALCVAAAALTAVPGAHAHGGTRSSGYVSSFSSLDPQRARRARQRVRQRTTRSSSRNYSGKPVVVLGREGEPYLRFTRAGGLREHALADDVSSTAPRSCLPTRIRGAKPPRGSKVAARERLRVARPPDRLDGSRRAAGRRAGAATCSHLIFRWSLPATAGGKPFRIKGFLGWAPPPQADRTAAGAAWVYAAAAAAAALAACGRARSGLRARRARRRAL